MSLPFCGKSGVFNKVTMCMLSQEAANLKDCFRLLWEQHVYWTRMTIISIAFDLPDLEPTTNRLLCNAPDFARLFSRFYGERIAAELDELIRDHLTIAAELVTAAKTGNTRAVADAEKRWYLNADEIVCFLNRINTYWSINHMRAMWYEHLALTKSEAVAKLSKHYAEDITIFDQIEKEALIMADYFTNGLIRQFHL